MNARNAAFKAIEDFFRKVSKTTTLTKSKSCSHLLSCLAMNNDFLQQGGKAKFGLSVSHLLDPLYMSLHSVSLIQKSFIYDLGYSQTLNSIFSAMFNPCHISSRNSCLLLCILVLLNISENVTSGIYWVIDKRLSQPMLFDASEKGQRFRIPHFIHIIGFRFSISRFIPICEFRFRYSVKHSVSAFFPSPSMRIPCYTEIFMLTLQIN